MTYFEYYLLHSEYIDIKCLFHSLMYLCVYVCGLYVNFLLSSMIYLCFCLLVGVCIYSHGAALLWLVDCCYIFSSFFALFSF